MNSGSAKYDMFTIKHRHASKYLEVCHPRCLCENWKGYAVKHNCVN